ncbi:hypothetical protein AMTR_s00094p00172930 [Amborella trichopoda]|uniref:Uncharacterized protein n=1 Tax=Amborella trichopoda TaxID=13333 RepID=W1NR70_AMBTC|nr:hypothetical protein AMTR_s00094p00172930 [Amborella trichopoda]
MAPELFSLSSQEDTVIQNAISIECPTQYVDLWPLVRRQHSESCYEYQHAVGMRALESIHSRRSMMTSYASKQHSKQQLEHSKQHSKHI